MSLGEKIKKAREDAGLSQKQLGVLIGKTDVQLIKYEKDRVSPNVHTLMLIAESTNRDLSYFLPNE